MFFPFPCTADLTAKRSTEIDTDTDIAVVLFLCRIMAYCFKLLLLLGIVLSINVHTIPAKQYDIRLCLTHHQFAALLDKYCAYFFARKRSIARQGEENPL